MRETQPKLLARPEEVRGPATWTTNVDSSVPETLASHADRDAGNVNALDHGEASAYTGTILCSIFGDVLQKEGEIWSEDTVTS